jgi:high-affinity Fe2+/Pb2+ permease
MTNLFVEALIAGIMVAIVGLIVSYIIMRYTSKEEASNFSHWGSIILSFFITGFTVHLVSEYLGINKNYCKTGHACTS